MIPKSMWIVLITDLKPFPLKLTKEAAVSYCPSSNKIELVFFGI